jgi:hypothetical protein
MRRALFGILAGTALALGSTAASASETLTPINSATLNAAGTSGPFGSVIVGQSSFADQFAFTLNNASFANGQVSTIQLFSLLNINFTSIYIDTVANSYTKTSTDPNPEAWGLIVPATLGAGAHTLFVNGNLVNGPGNASYSATLNIAPVPEPGTWALMLLGFGAIGFAMRGRGRRLVLAQAA